MIPRALAHHPHLPARQVSLLIKTNNGIKEYKTDFYVIDLADSWQSKYTIRDYGVKEICHCLARRWTVGIQTGLFDSSKLNWPLHRREGKVDVLLGSRPGSSQLHANPRATPMFNPLFPRPPLTFAPYVRASLMGRSQGRKLMGGFAVIYS